jgi:AraC family transcriptional regulator
MRFSAPPAKTIDYRQANASEPFVPNPAVLTSSGWESLYVELHQQPKFEIAEHQHTMHVIACGLQNAPEDRVFAIGERWLAGKQETERRQLGDIAIVPAGIAHRCNWNTTARFGILAIEPSLLQQIGQDWINPDLIELIPRFMSERDDLIQGIFSTLQAELVTGGIGGNLLVDSLKTALAIHLLRHYCTTAPKLSSYANGLSADKLKSIADYINAHLDSDLKLSDLSTIVNISPLIVVLPQKNMAQIQSMTVPLWGLVVFIGWTISIVCLLLALRIRHLVAGGAIQDFGTQDDKSILWRLFRVQSNLVENLPLYLGVAFLLTLRGAAGTASDVLVIAYIAFRLIHSLIHIAGLNPMFRVLCLAIQFGCLIALTTLAIV